MVRRVGREPGGGTDAHGCRVPDRGRRGAARVALPAGPRRRALADDRDGARVLRGEGNVPRPLRRGVRGRRPRGVVFDNRNFGASDGEPRQEIDPWQQINDYRDAISYALTRPRPTAHRIGVWGSSYSGAHVLVLGAIDRRIKCVASQVPLISGYRNARRLIRADMIARCSRCRRGPAEALPGRGAGDDAGGVEDPAGPAALPTPDSWQWFTETGRTRAPAWQNWSRCARSSCSSPTSPAPTSS